MRFPKLIRMTDFCYHRCGSFRVVERLRRENVGKARWKEEKSLIHVSLHSVCMWKKIIKHEIEAGCVAMGMDTRKFS